MVGRKDGVNVGKVGFRLGMADTGFFVGPHDGTRVGNMVGSVGTIEGKLEGSGEGIEVGSTDGV